MKLYFKILSLAVYFSLLLITIGCKKDPAINTPETYHPTPYSFSALPDDITPVSQFIPLNNPITIEGVLLGRMLFYDSTLSKDNTIACASCHHQGYAFSDRGRQFSFGVGDSIGNRNSMALFNIPWERGGFFWDARAPILDSQIVGPVPNVKEMHEPWSGALAKIQARPEYPGLFFKAFGSKTVTKENTVMAIAQFLRTIVSFNSKYDSVHRNLASFTGSELRGKQLFESDPVRNTQPGNHSVPLGHRLPATGFDCQHCHAPPLFVPESFIPNNQVLMNNGFGTTNFKVPSLRNLKFSAPYMHDGSMPNLDSVLAHYDHEIDPNSPYVSNLMYAKKYTNPSDPSSQLATPHMEMTSQDIIDLKAFLNTLNDYSLLTNKNYSNPFLH